MDKGLYIIKMKNSLKRLRSTRICVLLLYLKYCKEVFSIKTIAICNWKGGVGKTTTCANLGIGLAMHKKKVLLIDNDPSGSLTRVLGFGALHQTSYNLADLLTDQAQGRNPDIVKAILRNSEGVDLIPANKRLAITEKDVLPKCEDSFFSLKQLLDNDWLKQKYDYVLIDCSPSISHLTVNALAACNSVIIPLQPEYEPAKGLQDILQDIVLYKRKLNPNLYR